MSAVRFRPWPPLLYFSLFHFFRCSFFQLWVFFQGRGFAGTANPRRSGIATSFGLRDPLTHAPHQNLPPADFSAGTTRPPSCVLSCSCFALAGNSVSLAIMINRFEKWVVPLGFLEIFCDSIFFCRHLGTTRL